MQQFPSYLKIRRAELGHGHSVKVRIVKDAQALAQDFAKSLLDEIEHAAGKPCTLIVPVGPVDQFPILADLINQRKLSCKNVVFINMDEYVTDDGEWIPETHPLSFRQFMDKQFYGLIHRKFAPPRENRIFPDPHDLDAIERIINARGQVDACFGGIGINGHLAFNEPPGPGETTTVEHFATRTTRVLNLSRETRTINSVTVGGEISIIPQRAITIGMKEILASRRLRFYCNRPWQSGVIRRVLHGPVTPACPASLLRSHSDVSITITEQVAAVPDVRLR